MMKVNEEQNTLANRASSPLPALLPCPFCGNERIVKYTTAGGELVGCDNCENDMVRLNMKDAIEAWNTRHRDAAFDALVEALERCMMDSFTASDGMAQSGDQFAKARYRQAAEALKLAGK